MAETFDTREYARRYIAAGLRPIPVWSPSMDPIRNDPKDLGKVPKDKHWADRPRPFSEFEFNPRDNLALACGLQPDGRWLVGLDFDTQEGERQFTLPDTMRSITPRGTHYYFEVPPRTPLGNWVKVGGVVDVKYARGALIAAPSAGHGGVRYQTFVGPVAKLPDDVLNWIYRQRKLAGFKVSGTWDRKGKQA